MSIQQEWEHAASVEEEAETPHAGNQFVQEPEFQDWYGRWAETTGLDPDPDHPEHKYDYRAAFMAGAEPEYDVIDNSYHWPSQFKADDHPNRFVNGTDTKTGQKTIEAEWESAVSPETVIEPAPEAKGAEPVSAPPPEGSFLGGLGVLMQRVPSIVADYIPETVGRSFRGGRKSIEETWLDKWIEENRLEGEKSKKLTKDEKAKHWFTVPFTGQKVTYGDAEESAENLAYSIANMIASMGAGAAAGGATGTVIGAAFPAAAPATIATGAAVGAAVGAIGAGTVFSGEATKDQFVDLFYKAFKQVRPEQNAENEAAWKKIRAMIDEDADWYGFWEAAPETVGNVLTMGIAGLGKGVLTKPAMQQLKKKVAQSVGLSIATKLGIPVAKAGAMLTEEMLTEALTQVMQSRIETKHGLRERPVDFGEALHEVAPQVLINTAVMGLGAAGATSLKEKWDDRQAKKKLGPVIDSWLKDLQTAYQAGDLTREDLQAITQQMKGKNPVRDRLQQLIDSQQPPDEGAPPAGPTAPTPAPPAPAAPAAGQGETADFEPATEKDLANLTAYLGRAREADDIKVQAAPATPETAQVQRVARALGLRAVYFQGEGVADSVNGTYEPDSGTIFINKTAQKPYLVILGHETLHRLHTEHADLYAKLDKYFTSDLDEGFKKYLEDENQSRVKRGFRPISPENVLGRQEYMADFVGQQFANPEFWKKVNAHDATLGRQLAQMVAKMIDQIRKTLRGQKIAEAKYFKNLNEVQDALAQTYVEFARREKKVTDTTVQPVASQPQAPTAAPTASEFAKGEPVTPAPAQAPQEAPKTMLPKEFKTGDVVEIRVQTGKGQHEWVRGAVVGVKKSTTGQPLYEVEYPNKARPGMPATGRVGGDFLRAPKEATAPAAAPKAKGEGLGDDQKAFIQKKVKELGSREAVLKTYAGDANVDKYARQLADELYPAEGKAAPPKAGRYYDEKKDTIVHVAKGPDGNFSFFRSRKPDKKPGSRLHGIDRWYDTKEEAEAALAEYAKERGWKEVDAETAKRLARGEKKPEPPVTIPQELADLAEKARQYSNGILFSNALTEEEEKRINSTTHPVTGTNWGTATFWTDVMKASQAPKEPEKGGPLFAPSKPKPKPGSQATTLRGAIRAMGGLKVGNMKGEFAEAATAVKFLLKNDGTPLDLAEQQLKEDGWLREDENLVDVLRDPENLRRNKVAGEGIEKREQDKTEQEKQFEKEMAQEPEEPPAGDYITLNAEDLPEGKKLTLITGHGFDGWDVYEVTEKDPFSITLKDGLTIELKPMERVQVRREDLSKADQAKAEEAEKQPEAKAEPEPQAEEKADPRQEYIAEQRKTRLNEVEVDIQAIDKDGNVYMVKEKADVALAENEKQSEAARRLLECLNS